MIAQCASDIVICSKRNAEYSMCTTCNSTLSQAQAEKHNMQNKKVHIVDNSSISTNSSDGASNSSNGRPSSKEAESRDEWHQHLLPVFMLISIVEAGVVSEVYATRRTGLSKFPWLPACKL